MERRFMVDPRNTEVNTPIRRPRKVNSKQGNPKDNTYTLINTLNTLSAVAATPTIDINISAPLISAPSQRRAELLASGPLFVPSERINSQKDKTPSDTILRMLYQRLEFQEKHLEFQDRHIKYQDRLLREFRNETKDLYTLISKLLQKIKGNTLRGHKPGHQIMRATTYTAVATEAAISSLSSPQNTQCKAPRSSGIIEKLHFALNLSYCDSQIIFRGTAYIKKRLIKGLKLQEETKGSIFYIIVDLRKTHQYLLEFDSDNMTLEACIHNNWVLCKGRI